MFVKYYIKYNFNIIFYKTEKSPTFHQFYFFGDIKTCNKHLEIVWSESSYFQG